tara:strand:+ start:158 stop:907 length:750 start_codon:yes stop_codon:yes gene_type:complete
MSEFTYKDSLERARKAVLDSRSKFAAPTAQETKEASVEGLMRPRARPEQTEAQGSTATGVGQALMEALTPEAPTESSSAPKTSPRPEARYETEFKGVVAVPGSLSEDAEFTQRIEALADKRGISSSELYKVIQGESGGNPTAQNKSGATGLFQFMPATARELGTTTAAVKAMSPSEQVDLYDKYLERWNYSGSNRLGIMQAAPAFANSSPDTVVYGKNSAAWKQNPGWRELNGGDITVRSINSYYAKQS